MAYLIFLKNKDGVENSLKHIAENSTDLNNLTLINTYKTISISDADFLNVKLNNKLATKYNGEVVTYSDTNTWYAKKEDLKKCIDTSISNLNKVLSNNPNSIFKNRIENYISVLNAVDIDSISYPLNMSLEQYLHNNNKIVLHHLQVS